jgi:hypothetical protein
MRFRDHNSVGAQNHKLLNDIRVLYVKVRL